jgi:hypothetical protein
VDLDGQLWADSKQIYRGGAGFGNLERGVLVGTMMAAGRLPRGWRELEAALGGLHAEAAGGPEARLLAETSLPLAADPARCAVLAGQVAAALAAQGVTLVAIRCRTVQPTEFNQRLDAGLNKSDILSHATLELAATLRASLADDAVLVWCDRHGGRRRYAALLTRHFSTPLVRAVEETPARSVYEVPAELPPADCRVEFCVGGESRIPVALASMTAKYVRELAMRAFNAFWTARVPELRETAGYPVDAARWRREAADGVAAERIGWDAVWRRA